MELTQAMLEETWKVVIVEEMDALADSPADFAEPAYVGWLDAQMGMPCHPLEYYARLGDIAEYERGWQEAQLEIETGINAAAELEAYRDGMEESEWLRGWQL